MEFWGGPSLLVARLLLPVFSVVMLLLVSAVVVGTPALFLAGLSGAAIDCEVKLHQSATLVHAVSGCSS